MSLAGGEPNITENIPVIGEERDKIKYVLR